MCGQTWRWDVRKMRFVFVVRKEEGVGKVRVVCDCEVKGRRRVWER